MSDSKSTEDVIDRGVFAELRETAGADFVVELVDEFLDEAPQLLARMHAALAADDSAALRRAAHSLKSNGLTFGAPAFAAQARALELGDGELLGRAGLARLETLYAQVAAQLKELCDDH